MGHAMPGPPRFPFHHHKATTAQALRPLVAWARTHRPRVFPMLVIGIFTVTATDTVTVTVTDTVTVTVTDTDTFTVTVAVTVTCTDAVTSLRGS